MSHAQAILALASTGMGMAIVSEETRQACFNGIVFRPVCPGPGMRVDLHALRQEDNRNPALAPFRGLAPATMTDQHRAAARSGLPHPPPRPPPPTVEKKALDSEPELLY